MLTGAAAYGGLKTLANGDVKEVAKVGVRININNKGQFTGIVFGGKTYKIDIGTRHSKLNQLVHSQKKSNNNEEDYIYKLKSDISVNCFLLPAICKYLR